MRPWGAGDWAPLGLGHLSQGPRELSLDGLHTLQLSSLWSSGTSHHPSSLLPWHCQHSAHMFKRALPAPGPMVPFLPTACLHLSPATPERKTAGKKNFLESTPAKAAKSNSEESK